MRRGPGGGAVSLALLLLIQYSSTWAGATGPLAPPLHLGSPWMIAPARSHALGAPPRDLEPGHAAGPGPSAPVFPVVFSAPPVVRGHGWSVSVGARTTSSSNRSIEVWLSNGTYNYSVTPPSGWHPARANGTVTVNGVPTNLLANLSSIPTSFGLAAVRGSSQLFIANESSGSFGYFLDIRDRATGALAGRLPVGPYAFAPVVSPAGDRLFVVSNNNGSVTTIDPVNDTVLTTRTVGSASYPAGLDPYAGVLYVPNVGANNVTEIGAENATPFGSIATDSGPSTAIPVPSESRLFVARLISGAGGSMDVVNLINGSIAKRVALASSTPNGGVYDPAVGDVFIADSTGSVLDAFNATTGSFDYALHLPAGETPAGPVLDPLNGMLYVGLVGKAGVAVLDPVSKAYVGTVRLTETPFAPDFDPTNGGIWATTQSGHGAVEINGTPTTVSVAMTPPPTTYRVTFLESGLPAGAVWSVQLGNLTNVTRNVSAGFSEPNGSYAFTVGAPAGYSANPTHGTVLVHGAGGPRPVVFARISYSVDFVESGLPGGTAWSVSFNGTAYGGSTGDISVTAPNGSYSYSVGPASGFRPTSASGTVSIAGSNQTVGVDFVAIPAARYNLSFVESGLRPGADWTVVCNGTSASSMTRWVNFSLPNGTYSIRVVTVTGYTSGSVGSSVNVSGRDVHESVAFHLVAPSVTRYTVSFQELGLPSGATWRVSLNGTWSSSTAGPGALIEFTEPNGTYSYSIDAGSGFTAVPASGTVSVDGANMSRTISFSSVPVAGSSGAGTVLGLNPLDWGLVALAGVVVAGVGIAAARRSRAPPPTENGPSAD
ncbi:MAG TPA: hypothetical protein VFF67_10880 [Thermoplasmata archaeon]|nr:hypothetical protein [Thermoplasmata archaeon]